MDHDRGEALQAARYDCIETTGGCKRLQEAQRLYGKYPTTEALIHLYNMSRTNGELLLLLPRLALLTCSRREYVHLIDNNDYYKSLSVSKSVSCLLAAYDCTYQIEIIASGLLTLQRRSTFMAQGDRWAKLLAANECSFSKLRFNSSSTNWARPLSRRGTSHS